MGRRMVERKAKELRDELTELNAEHLRNLKTEAFITISKEQKREHSARLKRIRELSDEYLALLRVDGE